MLLVESFPVHALKVLVCVFSSSFLFVFLWLLGFFGVLISFRFFWVSHHMADPLLLVLWQKLSTLVNVWHNPPLGDWSSQWGCYRRWSIWCMLVLNISEHVHYCHCHWNHSSVFCLVLFFVSLGFGFLFLMLPDWLLLWIQIWINHNLVMRSSLTPFQVDLNCTFWEILITYADIYFLWL